MSSPAMGTLIIQIIHYHQCDLLQSCILVWCLIAFPKVFIHGACEITRRRVRSVLCSPPPPLPAPHPSRFPCRLIHSSFCILSVYCHTIYLNVSISVANFVCVFLLLQWFIYCYNLKFVYATDSNDKKAKLLSVSARDSA